MTVPITNKILDQNMTADEIVESSERLKTTAVYRLESNYSKQQNKME